jgi:pimeloyl-ACP methyl ester carboxylesterase
MWCHAPRMGAMNTSMPDSASATCKQIQLQDKRLLAYAEYGDPQGKPVMLFHGTPGSRLFHHPDESIALSVGARVIVPDRPGFGLSDFRARRCLLDWPDDVVQLADALGIDRFAVAGISGGGPYAIACALRIPHRLTRAALISSMAPLSFPASTEGMMWRNRLLFRLSQNSQMLTRLSWWIMSLAYRQNPQRFFAFETGLSSRSERDVINRPEVESILVRDYGEALRTGVDGVAWETIMLAQPWGFRLEDVAMETHLWHGEEDARTPIAMGRYLAANIPNCRAAFLSSEGHEVFYSHWREILCILTPPEVREEAVKEVSTETQKKPRRRVTRRVPASDAKGTAASEEPRQPRHQSKPKAERAPRTRKQLTTAGSASGTAS